MLNTFREKSSQHGLLLPKPTTIGKKRPLEEDEVNDCEMECSETKRPCPSRNNDIPSVPVNGNMEKLLNFPLPSTETVGCIVKMYSEEELPLNDILEVVGVLSFNTPGVAIDDEEQEDFQPPSSIIPRIHCITAHKWQHNNPYLSSHVGRQWEEGLKYF